MRGVTDPVLPIYYLNLAASPDRRAFMEGQFAALGLAAQRIEAIPAATIDPLLLARYGDPRRRHWVSAGELACSLTHIAIMQAFLATGAPHAVVFEDDAVLSRRLPRFLAAFAATPPPFDLVKLETYEDWLRLPPDADAEIAGIALRPSHTPSQGTAGYILARRAADFVSGLEPARSLPFDHVLFDPYGPAGRLSVRLADPGLCIQQDRLADTAQPPLASLLAGQRNARERAEHEHYWRRLPFRMSRLLHETLVIGPRNAWLDRSIGTRKRQIEFLPE